MTIIKGIKRLLYGSTSFFGVRQGSCSLRGTSFVELYRETTKYPTTIIAFDIKKESKNKAEFRIMCDGEKVFPFTETNEIPDGSVNVMPIDFAAGSLMVFEVKGMMPNDGFIVLLSEMNVIERR